MSVFAKARLIGIAVLCNRDFFAVLLAAGCLAICGCPGGGVTVQLPPEYIPYGQPTKLEMELVVWGYGSSKVSNRYTRIQCHYRGENAQGYTTIPFHVKKETDDRLIVQCELPAFQKSAGDYVEYYIDCIFDGHYDRRPTEHVPLKEP